MYKIGDRVKVISDNEGYDEFRDEVLIVTHIATNESQHPGYDQTMGGEQLMDFKTESGIEVGCSLYSYEINPF